MQLATYQYRSRSGWKSLPDQSLDSNNTLVLAFGASRFHQSPEPLTTLSSLYPSAHVVGCSTAGEIYDTMLEDDSLSVAVVRFDATQIATAFAPIPASEGLFGAGQSIAQQLYQPNLQAVLVFSDGTNVNGSELVRGLNASLPASVVVTGGLAGDGDRFGPTWVLHNRQPERGMVCGVGLYGTNIRVGHGSKGGWDLFGPEREVTRSEKNVVYELAGKPALQLYKSYLGELAAGLPASALLFPLAVRSHAQDEKRIVRTILSVDEATQSLTFAGDIPQGSLVQLMRANMDRLVEGASEAASSAKLGAPVHGDSLSIAISCVGRRLVLGERTEEELEATMEVLPSGTQQVGFYSYGEISPYASGSCDLHNQTMTLTTLWEE